MILFLLGVIDGVDVAAGVEVATDLATYEFDSVDPISHRLFAPAFHLSDTRLRFHAIIQRQISILACSNQASHGGGGF